MTEPNESPGKETPETEYPKTKKPSRSGPTIETPEPPQIMDPSVHPDIERKTPSTSPGKRKGIFKTHVKLVIQPNPRPNVREIVNG